MTIIMQNILSMNAAAYFDVTTGFSVCKMALALRPYMVQKDTIALIFRKMCLHFFTAGLQFFKKSKQFIFLNIGSKMLHFRAMAFYYYRKNVSN